MSKSLSTSIEYLKGVGPERAKLLKEELSIHTFQDLLYHFPFRYSDRSQQIKITSLVDDKQEVLLQGRIVGLREIIRGKRKQLIATFSDSSGKIDLIWFRYNKWFKENLPVGESIIVFGKPSRYREKWSLAHPEIDKIDTNLPVFSPIYPSTEKLQRYQFSQRTFRKLIEQLLKELNNSLRENLSEEILKQKKIPPRNWAFQKIHFPSTVEELKYAQNRIKYEELFFLQLKLLLRKSNRSKQALGNAFTSVGSYFEQFYKDILPFELTNAQKRVMREIRTDLGRSVQMNRLLQGDVGSGKTVIATMSILLALDNSFQACLMAPTEILAQQHFNGISELLAPLEISVGFLSGSVKTKERKQLLEELKKGDLKVLIGTHALIEDPVQFKDLGLAIIDEQHKFGVAQRAKLHQKAKIPPHILVMTATPIPRTLAMTLYGDLDFSVIDELPIGRKEIKTTNQYDSKRLAVFEFMRKQMESGRQVYVVYPLIDESKTLDYKDLMDGFESISRYFPLPKYAVSIVHGQMSAEDKEFEMQRFVKGETQILVATTVIEVGVNVPNASLMVIESAERFGLSQLHQLRGRVGRSEYQSYCILMTSHKLSVEGKKRIETMVRTNDGFEIAEADLQLRGPGDILGTQQSGVLRLHLAKIHKDQDILSIAREDVQKLLEKDPQLSQDQNIPIKNYFNSQFRHEMEWGKIG